MNENTDDIALSAYIDGELPDDAASKLKARLVSEPALAQRLEVLRGSDSEALKQFAAIDDRPMPQGVLDMLEKSSATEDNCNVVAFPKRGIKQFFQMPVAIAASVALLAGFMFADIFRASQQVAPGGLYAGQLAADSALHEFLETGVSSAPQPISDNLVAELLLTFEDRNGDFCRQLRVDGGSAPVQGLACRRSGSWQVEALGIAGERAPDGSYQAASGDTPKAIDSAIDSLIGPLPPLDLEEESSLISMGWKKSTH